MCQDKARGRRRVSGFACIGLSVVGSMLLVVLAANAWVVSATQTFVVDDMARLGHYDVGVVLGTSPYTRSGHRNALFAHRMMTAARLYAAGKVRHLLVSGANPDRSYNEPRQMYQALRRLGVPDRAMTMDFAGFRTLDSVVRAQRIFGLGSYVVISQRYHVYRALFIAHHNDMDAVAYIPPGEDRRQPLRTEAREYLARFRAILDLFVFATQPRFLGPRHPIETEPAHPYGFVVLPAFLNNRYRADARATNGDTRALSTNSPRNTASTTGAQSRSSS